jgi:CPA1 family monovalent cation:H+ antiporter
VIARDIADAASKAAITAFRDGQTDPAARAAAEQMLKRASVEDAAQRQSHSEHDAMVLQLGRTVLEARRAALVAARDERKLDDEVLREIMEEIDLQQAVLANWEPGRFSD